MISYWYKLLDFWVNKKDRNGLTIPFIIGVHKQFIEPSLEMNSSLISNLISEIVESDMPQLTSLFRCNEVQEFVFGLDDRGGVGRDLIFYSQSNEPTLVVGNWLFKTPSIEEIKTILSKKYLDIIYQNTYSKNNGKWSAFTELDLKFIKDALM